MHNVRGAHAPNQQLWRGQYGAAAWHLHPCRRIGSGGRAGGQVGMEHAQTKHTPPAQRRGAMRGRGKFEVWPRPPLHSPRPASPPGHDFLPPSRGPYPGSGKNDPHTREGGPWRRRVSGLLVKFSLHLHCFAPSAANLAFLAQVGHRTRTRLRPTAFCKTRGGLVGNRRTSSHLPHRLLSCSRCR